jgi:hypothetical protein
VGSLVLEILDHGAYLCYLFGNYRLTKHRVPSLPVPPKGKCCQEDSNNQGENRFPNAN